MKITATDEQWEEIERIKLSTITSVTTQYSHAEINAVVNDIWSDMGYGRPITLVMPSPMAMIVCSAQLRAQLSAQLRAQLNDQLSDQLDAQIRDQLRAQLSAQLRAQLNAQLSAQLSAQLRAQLNDQLSDQLDAQLSAQLCVQLSAQLRAQLSDQLSAQLGAQLSAQPRYVGIFWKTWAAWFAGSKALGVKLDERKLDLFARWCDMASVCCPFKNLVVVSENPVECHWLDRELHNDAGPAVRWADDYSMWNINGVVVDEEIVMRPKEQAINTIRNEKNEEVKRIRIERYGWDRFMKAVKAKPINSRRNDVDGTHEGLFELPGGMKTFVGRCRSTGRVYFLEVAAEIETCEQAQSWMVGRSGNCIGAS